MKLLIKIAAIIVIYTISLSSYAKEMHDNKVCFKQMITRANLVSMYVTKNQPYTWGITLTDDNHCLNVEAGRHGGSDTVTWVQDQLASYDGFVPWFIDNMTSSTNGIDNHSNNGEPTKLNFAIRVNITLNSMAHCYNIILAQAGFEGGNWWWLISNINAIPYTTVGNRHLTYIDCEVGINNVPTIFKATPNDDNHGNYTFDLNPL